MSSNLRMSFLKVHKLTDKARLPERATSSAAGVDLFSAYTYFLPPRSEILVQTDLQIQVPEGSYGRVAPRSGLAIKNFIHIGAGVVDSDYRGNLGVVVFNLSDNEHFISIKEIELDN